MSRFQSTRRRLSLLASSSLALAGMAAVASFSVALAPTKAHAANECAPVGVDPTVNPGADSYVCDQNDYTATGITYSSSGDLTVTATPPIDPVYAFPLMQVGAEGVNLTGNGADAITWDSSAATVSGTAGAVIDVTADSGNITITTGEVGDYLGAGDPTHGIRAMSGAGDITVTTTGYVNLFGAGGQAGIAAHSTAGGNVTVTAAGVQGYGADLVGIDASSQGGDVTITTLSTVSAGTYGIRASAEGTGDLSITGSGIGTTAGIAASTQTGLLTIDGGASSFTGTGILVNAGGDVQLNLTSGVAGALWAIDLNTSAGSSITINNTSAISGANSDLAGANALRAQGGGDLVINNTGVIAGRIDLSSFGGAMDLTLAEDGLWRMAGVSVLSAFGDTVTVAEGAGIQTFSVVSEDPNEIPDPTEIAFGAGDDVLDNAGTIRAMGMGKVRLTNLETFLNSGTIYLGMDSPNSAGELVLTFAHGNVLSMPGADYVSDGGNLVLNVNFSAGGQTDCTTRDAERNLRASDCLMIVGGSTSGTTTVEVRELLAGDLGAYAPEGIVIVDVAGGESHAGDFILSSESTGYSSQNGGVIDKGLFFATLAYDEKDQQHKLFTAPGGNALQFPLLAQAAHSVWRTSTGSWLERQADLRSNPGSPGGGLWARLSADFAGRDTIQSVDVMGDTFSFDNTSEQDTYAVTGGIDLIAGSTSDSAYVLGVTAGYVHADVEFENSPNNSRFDGWTGGVYASFLSGGLFVDAVLNANKLILKNDIPVLELFPAGTLVKTDLLSVGGQVEAGWRFSFAGGAFVEPLVGVSYVRTTYDDMRVPSDDASRPGVEVEFDDPTSLRASIGGRLGLDQDFGGMRAQYSVLARLWNEFEGENSVILHNIGPDALLTDTIDGQFTEFGVGASLFNASGTVSGFLSFGGKYGDDYQSANGSAGVRVTW